MLRKILTVLLIFTGAVLYGANPLDLDGGEATSVGILIKDLRSGQIIKQVNPELALTPASVTKLVTSATALRMLGGDFRFSTPVLLQGRRTGARFEGDIVIEASADPTLGSDEFKRQLGFTDSIVTRLRRLGISEITGTVVINQKLSGGGPLPQWECEDIPWAYGAALYGFNWAGNTVRVYPATGKTLPPSGLEVTALPSADGSTDLLRGAGSDNLTVLTSKKNLANRGWNVTASVPDPAAIYTELLCGRLRSAGVRIGSRPASGTSTDRAILYTHRSAPLTEICRSLMKNSDNLFAEGMLRALRPGDTRKDCIKAEKDYWDTHGAPSRYTIINDGSGLTRANRLSATFLAEVLEQMAKSPVADDYVSFFPLSGVDGTLKGFLKDTPLKGRLALKTGSVSAVQAYAGYFLDEDGRPTHTVVVLVNGFFCPRRQLRQQIEHYLLNTFAQ